MPEPAYSFGDTPTAADRLALLAHLFAPEMRAFLERWAHRKPDLALDLGCGPGHTTVILAEAVQAGQTVGLDTSDSFLALADGLARQGLSFLRHDVTQAPFPTGSADLMFAHFLLYHLPDSAAALEIWRSQLRPGGVILVDDIEAMESDHPVLRRYLAIVGSLVQHSGGNPAIGAALARLDPIPGLRVVSSNVIDFAVATNDAATMFRMNLETWRTHPFIAERYPPSELGELAAGLDELRAVARRGDIQWKFRQTVFARGG